MPLVVKNVLPSTSDKVEKSVHIETLGCRLNQIESEAVAFSFSQNNFAVTMNSVTAKDEPDSTVVLSILNTCTVTAKAQQKARRIIRLHLKKFPSSVVAVTGCYAQINPQEISQIDERVVAVPGRVKSRLLKLAQRLSSLKTVTEIKTFLTNNLLLEPVPEFSENAFSLSTDVFLAHSRSSIKIQDGCNNRCTYCQICLARGASVSLDAQLVIDRVNALTARGQKEIVITTVNIADYKGRYKEGFVNFEGLLKLLLENTKDCDFRISSIYPQIVTPAFCELIKSPRIKPHFHLSVQSGSDRVLKDMARPYTRQTVIDCVRMLRDSKPQSFFACDIIAGFPRETQQDFDDTMELLKVCDFTYVHAFPFSPRPNTKASLMKPKVPENVRDLRVQQLIDFAVTQKIKFINEMISKEFDAVAEFSLKPQDQSSDILNAVLDNFIHVKVKIPQGVCKPVPSQKIRVRITECNAEAVAKLEEWEAFGILI